MSEPSGSRAPNPAGYWLEAGHDAQSALDPVMAVMDTGFDAGFGEAWNRAQTRSMLSMPLSYTIIARSREENDPIGFALTRRVMTEEELLLIAVLPDWRHRGIGTGLIEAVLNSARVAGVEKVFLEVRNNNSALNFYHQFGFNHVGTRKNYYIGPNSQQFDALTLEIRL